MVEISKKNVAFSEYMNFNRNHSVSQPVGIFRVDQKGEDKFIFQESSLKLYKWAIITKTQFCFCQFVNNFIEMITAWNKEKNVTAHWTIWLKNFAV